MMQGRTILLILAAVACNAVGQLCLKTGARRLRGLGSLEFLGAAVRDPYVLSGLGAWVAWTLCWLYALRVAPLSRAYGMTSLTYVLVPVASVYLFGESLRRFQLAGMVLILVGIVCLLSAD
jgi:drug/metabolite transporter (DMT)-like permease